MQQYPVKKKPNLFLSPEGVAKKHMLIQLFPHCYLPGQFLHKN